VLVPNTAGMDINHVYASIQRAGLRVSYLSSFSEGSFASRAYRSTYLQGNKHDVIRARRLPPRGAEGQEPPGTARRD
jgi:hypothetical protein